jgi:ribonuclease-3|tara:strand:- start:2592 stop:3434 length:843 start_codon:yes stop_codon:yes gene_type:complete
MKKLVNIHNKTKEITEALSPFNNTNIILNENDLNNFFNNHNIDYPFKNINLFRNAFVHKSYCCMKNSNFTTSNISCPVDCLPLQEMPYERLEFLGDSILGYVIAKYMYIRYPDQSEGFLSKMRTKIVNGKMLGFLAEKVGFIKFAIISKQIEDINGRDNYKIMEDIFEAFIGALFMDSNDINIVEKWIINIIEKYVDFVQLIIKNTNYKDALISYMQNRYQDMPRFLESNVSHNNMSQKVFTYIVKDRNNNILGSSTGSNKKDAENNCALEALKYYGEEV